MPKKQIKLKKFCEAYDMPRTTVMEIVHRNDFPSYKLNGRWYIDEEKYLKWREVHNLK